MLARAAALHFSLLVVELPADWAASNTKQVEIACSEAVAPDHCVVPARDRPIDEPSTSTERARAESNEGPRAQVEQIDEFTVLVEVIWKTDQAVRSAVRELRFRPQDDPSERAQAVGLAVGLLARSLRPAQTEAPAPKRSESPAAERATAGVGSAEKGTEKGSSPPPQAAGERTPPRGGVDAESTEPDPGNSTREPNAASLTSPRADGRWGSLGARGLFAWDAGLSTAEFGGGLQVGVGQVAGLSTFASLELSAGSSRVWDVRRSTVGLGLGYHHFWGNTELSLLLEAGAQNLAIALPGATGALASGDRWSPVVQAGLEARFFSRAPVSPTLGGKLGWVSSPTVVIVDGIRRARSATLVPVVFFGVLWAGP